MLEEEINKHPEKDATAKWAIELLSSRRYKRYLEITKDKKISINEKAIHEAAKNDGKWVLETNDDTITVDDAASGYRGLMIIERCFRSLKRAQIKINPVYHWLSRRIESHVRICVIALLIERIVEIKCSESWLHIRNDLKELQITRYNTPTHTFNRRNKISDQVKEILNILKIPPPKIVLGISKISEGSSEK